MSETSHRGYNLENADPRAIWAFDLILKGAEKSPMAMAVLEAIRATGTNIGMNPYGADNYPEVANPGGTMYDPDSDTIIWNYQAGLQVFHPDGTIAGVQSALLGLIHESAHALDPDLLENLAARIPGGLRNLAEKLAIEIENQVARELGEPERTNWKGKEIFVSNPTTSTIEDENGGLLWAQLNEFGVWEYGPYYLPPGTTPESAAPGFGGTAPPADVTTPPDGRWFPDDFANIPPFDPFAGFPSEHDMDWTLNDFPSEHDLDWTLSPLIANRETELAVGPDPMYHESRDQYAAHQELVSLVGIPSDLELL
jgi:hypothetical protein